jgi:hypothetical protein
LPWESALLFAVSRQSSSSYTLVLACFALSPQAFADKVKTPTFIPDHYCGCKHLKWVTISSGTLEASIFVSGSGQVGRWIPNNTAISLHLGTETLQPFAHKPPMTNSDWGCSGTYKYKCPCLTVRLRLDWRTSYYRQAHNTPWWPNAPGG